MKVAIVGNYPVNSTQIRGGVQAAFHYLVKGLRQRLDLEVHILTMRENSASGITRLEQDGVTIHLLPPFPRLELLRDYRTYQRYLNDELAAIRPDLVHAQGASIHAYVALRSKFPCVVTAHGIRREEGRFRRSPVRRVRNWLRSQLVERRNFRRMRHFIAISNYVAAYFAPLLRKDVKIYHIPNAIDSKFFDLPDKSTGHTILFAGNVILLKRVLTLLQAFEKVVLQTPAAQLRIAGSLQAQPAYTAEVRQFITERHLQNNVKLLGLLSEDAILDEFSRCDVLTLPSAQENAPMVIAQAMAAKKAVVATAVGGVPEMIQNSQSGFLVKVGDIDALAEKLQTLLQNPLLRGKMGQAGHQFAVDNYHFASVARRTWQVYREIASAFT